MDGCKSTAQSNNGSQSEVTVRVKVKARSFR
jgi:hypothetical protein